ncbi:MAG: HEPN domain-containing protein [Candidatus Hydrogenedentes bacterium]|nr:HEPN domain-containing protein [Candidatus Hydrogenedentota bacterium]
MREESLGLLQKARRALRAADVLLHSGDSEFATGRAYYAMLYTAEALLRERGLEYAKHAAVHSAYGMHFAKTALIDPKFHRWMLEAFSIRLTGDYDISASIEPDIALSTIEHAREFLDAAERFLGIGNS